MHWATRSSIRTKRSPDAARRNPGQRRRSDAVPGSTSPAQSAPKWLGAYWQPNPLMPVSRVQVRDPDPCGTEAGNP
ncbi:MAG TPA: hypothetical protein VFL07_07675, partial [Rudaea sp.]|nr:hypothetical protein [Rudaea sp.]